MFVSQSCVYRRMSPLLVSCSTAWAFIVIQGHSTASPEHRRRLPFLQGHEHCLKAFHFVRKCSVSCTNCFSVSWSNASSVCSCWCRCLLTCEMLLSGNIESAFSLLLDLSVVVSSPAGVISLCEPIVAAVWVTWDVKISGEPCYWNLGSPFTKIGTLVLPFIKAFHDVSAVPAVVALHHWYIVFHAYPLYAEVTELWGSWQNVAVSCGLTCSFIFFFFLLSIFFCCQLPSVLLLSAIVLWKKAECVKVKENIVLVSKCWCDTAALTQTWP